MSMDEESYYRKKYTQSELRGVPLKSRPESKKAPLDITLKPINIKSAATGPKLVSRIKDKAKKISSVLLPEEKVDEVVNSKGIKAIIKKIGL